MASPPSTLEHLADLPDSRFGRRRTRVDPYPFNPWLRWLVRLLFALPYLAVSILERGTGLPFTSPNQATLERIQNLDWTRADVGWVSALYPPVGTILASVVARVIPLGLFGLALLGCAAAGYFLQKVLEVMVQRQLNVGVRVLFLVALGLNPFTFYLVTENGLLFLSLAWFGLGVSEMVRFLYWGSTRDGFRAGIFLMLAAFTDPMGITFVAVASVASLFLIPRELERPGRRRASALVVAFPTIGGLVMWGFLEWAFGGLPARFFTDLFAGSGARLAAVGALFASTSGILLILQLISKYVLSIAVRRPRAIIMSTLTLAVFFLGYVIGFAQDNSAGGVWIMLLSLTITVVPAVRGAVTNVIVMVVAAVQIPLLWFAALENATVESWLRAMGAALGS